MSTLQIVKKLQALCKELPPCSFLRLQDLQYHPANGWSRRGLLQVAKAAGSAEQELERAKQQWQQAWADADVHIHSSCPALAQPFKTD